MRLDYAKKKAINLSKLEYYAKVRMIQINILIYILFYQEWPSSKMIATNKTSKIV